MTNELFVNQNILCHCTLNDYEHTTDSHINTFDTLLDSLQEQDTLGDAEERCTQLMHQKVQLEESVQVIYL